MRRARALDRSRSVGGSDCSRVPMMARRVEPDRTRPTGSENVPEAGFLAILLSAAVSRISFMSPFSRAPPESGWRW
jgi:hypothetical protein